ncbi:MAG: hypothetical protein ABII90_05120, partial [Bacteroidota bacterium]
GFRRGQIQLIYKITSNEDFVPMIQVSVGEATKESSGFVKKSTTKPVVGADNMAGSPMIQGRVSAKMKKKYELGVFFVSASYDDDPDTSAYTYGTSGFGVDFNLPLHKYFALKGEFNTGTNLNNANLFNVAGNHGWDVDTATGADNVDIDKLCMGLWFNITSKIHDHFNLVIGYGMDMNQTDDLGVGAIESNSVFYADLIFPIKHGFSVALELQSISTTIGEVNVTDPTLVDFNAKSAMVINLAGKVTF